MEYSNDLIASIFKHMYSGYAYHKIIVDNKGQPVDYIYLDVNDAFEKMTNLKKEEIINKSLKEIMPNIEFDLFNWIEFYGKVALTGKAEKIEQYSSLLNKWYLISAFSTKKGYFVTLFMDITQIKNRELELIQKNKKLEELHEKLQLSEEALNQQVNLLNSIRNKLLQNEKRLKKAQSLAKVGNWELDLNSGKIWASDEAFNIYGIENNTNWLDYSKVKYLVDEKYRTYLDEALNNLIYNNKPYDVKFKIHTKNTGKTRYIHSIGELIRDKQGSPIKVTGVIQDITERVLFEKKLKAKNEEVSSLYEEIYASEEELRQQFEELSASRELLQLSEIRYKTLVNNSYDVIYSCDLEGRFTAVNLMFCEIHGIHEDDVVGKKMEEIDIPSYYYKPFKKALKEIVETKNPVFMRQTHTIGENKLHYDVIYAPIFDLNNNVIGITGNFHDITELVNREKEIKYMAYHDFLTGLPNRKLFSDILKKALKNAKKNNTKFAVLFLDIDDFKRINDTLGHSVGDELLIEIAKRLDNFVQEDKKVSRLNGDEFAILLKNVDNFNDVAPVIFEIQRIFNCPYNLSNHTLDITASIGIALYPKHGETIDELLKNADTAMYKAKEIGNNNFVLFNSKIKENMLYRVEIEKLLKKAISNNEFLLYYQPQYSTNNKKLRGFEALIRWNSPELGWVSPRNFISIAEECGLITTIGEWVIECACKTIKKVYNELNKYINISVNISTIQFRQLDFDMMVIKFIEMYKIPPHCLELELTESVFINNYEEIINTLNNLRNFGISIALDDFGTGYSSLSYLQKLPINLLKIDKSFIDVIDPRTPEKDLTETIVSLVHKLGMETIAEGVETQEQCNYLSEINCDHIQGYLLGKPMPEEEMKKLLINS